MNVQQLHQRIPAFKQILYGKIKTPLVTNNVLQNTKKQALIREFKNYTNPKEYLKFIADIRLYDWKQAVPTRILDRVGEIDFDDIANDFDTFSFVYYDILGTDILVYLVQWKHKKYLCLYNFSRYYQTMQHPTSKLVFCVSYK